MRRVDAQRPGIKPVYWAYLRACIRLLDAGKSVTQLNLARELKISHQAVWMFCKRNPGVMAFVDDELRAQNARYYGLVQRRMAHLGMAGSVAHAETYFKTEAGVYARSGAGPDGVPVLPGGGGFTLNLLVPRPDSPGLVAAPAPQPSSGLIPRPSIPTVGIR